MYDELDCGVDLPGHVWAVVPLLEDSDVYVRRAAMQTLGKLEPAALAQHQQAIAKAAEENSDAQVQIAARVVMHKLEPAAGHMDAVAAKLEDPDEDVRYAAVQTLGKLESAALAQHGAALAARLEDFNEFLRLAAVERLGKLEPVALAQHGAALAARLEDSQWLVRQAAVETLGKLDLAALALHEQAIANAAEEDKDSDVRRAAAKVLTKLRAGK